MATQIKIPAIGESITEVTLASWLKKDGDYVEEGEILCEIESDKATVDLPSPVSGVLKITAEDGSDQKIGAVIGSIDESQKGSSKKDEPKKEEPKKAEAQAQVQAPSQEKTVSHPSPAARKILTEKNISPDSISGTGKDQRITKEDAMKAQAQTAPSKQPQIFKEISIQGVSREVTREKMSRLRKTIATRLVEAKNTTAMLTTFNEVDMKAVMDIRKKYKDKFKEEFGVNLGFMSFFTKAVTIALKKFPMVGGMIDGEDLVQYSYADVGIAVSSDKGLVVPVLRNAESLSLWQIESEIARLAAKVRDGKITIDEMSGGNFTITNGGIFGSMLSTPIINIPQSAILGMHNIVERAWVVDGKIEIRPIMYLALSYDHRIIDGKESVSFLKTVKELLEDPTRMLLDL